MRKRQDEQSGRHAHKMRGHQGDSVAEPHSARPWAKTSVRVIQPLSLKQENPKCGGKRGAPGFGGPCPVV